jgi:heme oxygenase (biliverdin-IX-beta and delta-forming)
LGDAGRLGWVSKFVQRSDLPTQLSSHTAHAHRRVEGRLVSGQWFRDLRHYGLLLQRLLALHQHVESAIAQLGRGDERLFENQDLTGRNRSRLIAADLASLGLVPGPGEDVPLTLSTDANLLGALYVLEGSTLGSQAVVRLLCHRLQLTRTAGAASFDPYGDDTATRWAEFRQFLCEWPGDQQPVVDAATAMFDFYESWVLRPPINPSAMKPIKN